MSRRGYPSLRRHLAVVTADRPCGSCTACCLLAVHALGKPAGVPCSAQQEGGGCVRYAARPRECSDFYCAYKMGHVEARPDVSGVLFVARMAAGAGGRRQSYMQAIGLRPGALEAQSHVLEALAEACPVVLYDIGDIYTPIDAIGADATTEGVPRGSVRLAFPIDPGPAPRTPIALFTGGAR